MKLCSHVFQGSHYATQIVEEGFPPAIKLIGGYNFAQDYKVKNPNLFVWARYVPGSDDLWRSYTPDDFYDTYMRPQITHPANQGVDAWEDGLNEDFRKQDGTEIPDYADMVRKGSYEARLAERIAADGKRPIVGQFSVGTPSGTYEQQKEAWRAYREAILAVARLSGYISLHTYGNVPGWDGPLKALIAVMAELGVSVPILVSECGNEPPWTAAGLSAADYAGQLIAFDNTLLNNYPQVKAAAIFACGNTPDRWVAYNVDNPTITAAIIEHGKATAPMTNATGIDVSHYQGTMNFAQAAGQGVSFVFIKASEALSPDSMFTTYWPAAKAAGLMRGAYHLYRFSQDPIAQADYIIKQLGQDYGELPIVVDVEDTTSIAPVPIEDLHKMLLRIEQVQGRRPIIYTAAWYWNPARFGGAVAWAKDYDLWVANYTSNPAPTLPTDWTTWKFWQYSSSGVGAQYGATSPLIDLDRFNGSIADLAAYSKAHPANPKPNIVRAQPVMPFSFYYKGTLPLFYMRDGQPVLSRVMVVDWQIDTTIATVVGTVTYWKVTERGANSEWMVALQLCG